MKKISSILLCGVLAISVLFANGTAESGSTNADTIATWPEEPVTVICNAAVGGVADLVNRKEATYGQKYLGQPVLATNELGAGGNVALTNYLKNKPNSYNLILGSESGFSIAPNVEGKEAIMFTYDDFVPIMVMYNAVMVMTSNADLNIKSIEDLHKYGQTHTCSVAVNGVAGAEAFLAKSLFKALGIKVKLVSYNGANLALDAVLKGETDLAISHQTQAKDNVEGGILNAVCVFNKTKVNNDTFGNTDAVGDYGIDTYYSNACVLLARKGTDSQIINKIRKAYLDITKEPEVQALFKQLMIEPCNWDTKEIDAHYTHVADIVKANQ